MADRQNVAKMWLILYFMGHVGFLKYRGKMYSCHLPFPTWIGLIEHKSHVLYKWYNHGFFFIILHFMQEAVAVSPDSQKNGLSREEFLSFYKELTTRPEVYFLLARFVCTYSVVVQCSSFEILFYSPNNMYY